MCKCSLVVQVTVEPERYCKMYRRLIYKIAGFQKTRLRIVKQDRSQWFRIACAKNQQEGKRSTASEGAVDQAYSGEAKAAASGTDHLRKEQIMSTQSRIFHKLIVSNATVRQLYVQHLVIGFKLLNIVQSASGQSIREFEYGLCRCVAAS